MDELALELPIAGHVIGGKTVESASGETLDVICPSDGRAFARIARGGPKEVDGAVSAARAAFEGAWGRLTATERGRLLLRLAEAVERRHGELSALESRDTGKPLAQGRADVTALVRYLEYYGSAADKLHGDTVPFQNGYTALVTREPLGVTGHIIPWNYPVQIFGRSVGASLAAGNACVVKPAEDACLTIPTLAALALEVGFPPGALNVVTGLGPEAGSALAEHPGVDFISFTGSPETGALVQAAAGRHQAGVTLELGGKSPQIVFADADLEAAVPVLVKALVQNGGQTCSAGSRVLVERPGYDRVVSALADRFRQVRAGHHEKDLDMGAMITSRQKARVQGYVDAARGEGIPVIAEGEIEAEAPSGGFYVRPVLFGPVPRRNRIAEEEVFGPVLAVFPFEDEADAIRLANAGSYGLVAGVWTENGARAMRLARAVRTGQVYVNSYGAGGGIELPFGGFRRSGHGREKGFEGLVGFTTTKTICIRHG